MTRPVAEILAEAERDGWPTSSIDAMTNHHLCGGRSPKDSGVGGTPEGCGSSPRQEPHPPTHEEEERVPDPNCQFCSGTGSVQQVVDVGNGVIIRTLPCHCQPPPAPPAK